MDKIQKKQLKKILSWVTLAAVVVLLAAMPLLAKAEAENDGPVATIHQETLQTGTVSTTLRGGGTLSTEDVQDIQLPTGVKITQFLVKNGDQVTEGTPLAAVDKVSVMTAITSVTETMDYLQEEIRSANNEKISSTVSATAGGRVKQVYARKGDSVQDVMLEHGALALLSLDGLMAVEIEKKTELRTGEAVTVTLSDGTEVTGRVASNLDGVLVITLKDDGYPVGEAVTVTDGNGTQVGEGELYVHNAWTATAFSGTIQTVNALEESNVTSGATLFTLTDTDFRGKLEYLSSLHREYEKLMQDLFKMYNSGTIDAPCAGTVSGIDKDSAHLLGAEDGQWQISLLDHPAQPMGCFTGFCAQVTGRENGQLQLLVDPRPVLLDNLYNLRDVPADAAMTEARSYSADIAVSIQDETGAIIPGGTAGEGDVLLFVGDETGVRWVVNTAMSMPTEISAAQGIQLQLLSEVQQEVTSLCDPTAADCPQTNPALHKPECLKACQRSTSCTATGPHYPDCIRSCSHADDPADCAGTKHHYSDCIKSCANATQVGVCNSSKHYLSCIESCVSSDGSRDCPATGKHKKTCIEACTHADSAELCEASLYHYPDCIKCCISSDSSGKFCPASKHNANCFFAAMTYKAKVAIVTGVGSSELVVRWDASGQEYEVEKTASGWKFAANPDFNVDLLVASGPKVSVANPGAYKVGDVIFVITGYKGTQPEWTGISIFMRVTGDADLDLDFDLSGLLGGLNGLLNFQMPDLSSLLGRFNFYAAPPVEEEKLFDLEGNTLMTVSPERTASLTISVDEQDIAKVSPGQKATVRVEALGDQRFEATVTEVGIHGTSNGGSSKFKVKLELPKTGAMLDGMSASASLPLQSRENVLTIPVSALVDQGARTVVYTALDQEGNLTSPVAVTIGLSDGVCAEVLSGLQEGDTYYYSSYDVAELDTSVEERFTLR